MTPHLRPILRAKQLKQLKEHKYAASGVSLCENVMQILWNKQINYIPLWMAPNLLTLIGLAANAFTSLILTIYSPDARREVPSWACILATFGLFVYQSLDALDGKQARRTQSSSPLGELFDHGCDSVSAVFAILSVATVTKMGENPFHMLLVSLLCLFVFYMAHWQTYVSGRLRFTTLNVTEAQFGVMFVLLVSGLFGTQMWSQHTWAKNGIIAITWLGSLHISISYVKIVFTGGAGKNKSTIADTSVLSPGIPFALACFAAISIFNKGVRTSNVFNTYICLYVALFGAIISKLTILLVVAHMTRSELAMTDSIFLGPALLALNQYYDRFIPETLMLWIAFAYVLFDLLLYVTKLCREIAFALKISIFTIPYMNNNSNQKPMITNATNTNPKINSIETHNNISKYNGTSKTNYFADFQNSTNNSNNNGSNLKIR